MTSTLFTIDNFLSKSECAHLVELAEQRSFEPAPITTSRGFEMMPDVRNNTRVMIDDAPRAASLWSRLSPFIRAERVGLPVGLNERFRFYRYRPGQCFRWHYDGRFRRDEMEESALTFMVYLNEDFEGGATEFDLPARSVVPHTGTALIFEHRLRHQGAPVVSGTKYVLRSDVMFRRAG
ncbi:MAG: oxidoreductase, 2OG-Fe(II) oxygenase [Polyangiaceae bacterium]|nr:oxidoreductase, 2OG-Fe(II) oxygenase [Polyangiaceae bacterium]